MYMLDLSEDYLDLPLLQEKDVYLIQAFVNNRCKSPDLKYLNFVREYIQAVPSVNISTVDGRQISHQAYKAQTSNRLRGNIDRPYSPTTLPIAFIDHWKIAVTKSFIN